MDIVESKNQLKKVLDIHRANGKVIGLVPTMGNLHDGHISLVAMAKPQCDIVATSIFVNPLQFGKNEDLSAYPRTLTEDLQRLEQAGCDVVFIPAVSEIYAENLDDETIIHVPGISEGYCGKSRPGHFDGVATVVSKLFHMVSPHKAYFGLKDYQQFLVINKMVRDLAMPIEIIGAPIKREASGLAMSSRNNYLSQTQRSTASVLNRVLEDIKARLIAGDPNFREILDSGTATIDATGMRTDYLAICNADDLTPADPTSQRLVVLAAAFMGATRLIDNIRFTLKEGHKD